MKALVSIFVIFLILSCNSVKKTKQAINSGNYTEAINRSVKQLQKNKFNKKGYQYANLLKISFEKFRESNLKRIDFLEKETLKNNAKPIYESYLRLQDIQNRIKPLLPLENEDGSRVVFEFYDFSDEIIAGKENYAEYLYVKASRFLDSEVKIDSRLAYNSFVELEKLAPGYKNTSSLKRDAYINGIDFVLVSLYNNTEQIIPALLEDRLLNFNTYDLDDLWTEYHVNPREDFTYDFAIDINFTSIQFSPERLLERQVPLERAVVDGWRFKKDRAGNFIFDQGGDKIKEDIVINVSGTLFETVQSKEVKVIAEVNYFDLISDQKINNYPLESLFIFENRFANFEGDKKVLNKDENYLLTRGPVNYPSHEQMLSDASEDIKAKLKSILKQQIRN
ncbi:hypothetical protein ES731_02815 [Psychroflexus gondwanensis]|jgi:hypothetical protein|uniref:hypothetical protein n=1 Tax=Psychroflexus gondwanensis TaxID=251 RepID=UPI0011BEC438|nr:hypothetical protein [Psychroflexus gondwanensis]TXE20976.1 hypothetical protein ES731_02815 [Psychroflexus gondwanensis]